jgi:hypothetical protein
MRNKIISLTLQCLLLVSCAPQYRDYIYSGENLEGTDKAIVVVKVYNIASFGAFNLSWPQVFKTAFELLSGNGPKRKDIKVGGQIYLTDGIDIFIIGQLKNPRKYRYSFIFTDSADLFADPKQEKQHMPQYDVVLLKPGTYKIQEIEYSFFTDLDVQTSAKQPARHMELQITLKPGEVAYLGDIQIMPETATLKITHDYKTALRFMDNKYPDISHRLLPKLWQG